MLKYFIVFFISMLPLAELRVAIPYAIGLGLNIPLTYVIAIIGNMLPVPFIFFFARRVLEWKTKLTGLKVLNGLESSLTFVSRRESEAARSLLRSAINGHGAILQIISIRITRNKCCIAIVICSYGFGTNIPSSTTPYKHIDISICLQTGDGEVENGIPRLQGKAIVINGSLLPTKLLYTCSLRGCKRIFVVIINIIVIC